MEHYKITLAAVSPRRTFYAGDENANIIFRLTNNEKNKIVIYEWFMNEDNNVRIYYHPYKKNMKIPRNKKSWKALIPTLTDNERRATLVLNYKNSVLISKKLPFIEKLRATELPQQGKEYLLFGELNLNSISAKTKILKIKIK